MILLALLESFSPPSATLRCDAGHVSTWRMRLGPILALPITRIPFEDWCRVVCRRRLTRPINYGTVSDASSGEIPADLARMFAQHLLCSFHDIICRALQPCFAGAPSRSSCCCRSRSILEPSFTRSAEHWDKGNDGWSLALRSSCQMTVSGKMVQSFSF